MKPRDQATETDRYSRARAAASAWVSLVGDDCDLAPMPRATNALWRLTAGALPPLVLKQLPEHPPGVEPVVAARVLAHLCRAGVTVAPPIITDAGTIVATVDGREWQLLPHLPHRPGGHGAEAETETVAHDVGTAIGQLDRALAGYPWEVQPFEDDPVTILTDALPRLPAELTRLVGPVAERLHRACAALPAQLIHGDCNDGNVLVDAEGGVGFIDIDHLPTGPRVGDLAYYLASRLRHHLSRPDANLTAGTMKILLERYIDGYHHSHPITRSERSAVVPLMLLTEISGAHWSLHGWEPNHDSYRRNLNTLSWLTHRLDDLTDRPAP